MILLLACADPPAAADCAGATVQVTPAAGAVDVSVDTQVTVTVDGAPQGIEVWVDGGFSDGWVHLDGEGSFTLTPAAPLAWGTTYTVQTQVCGETSSAAFTTAEAPVTLDGAQVYLLDFAAEDAFFVAATDEGTWAEVPFGDLLRLLGSVTGFLVRVAPSAGDEIEVAAALAAYDPDETTRIEQWPCGSPMNWGAVSFADNPRIRTGSRDLGLTSGMGTLQLYEASLTGRLSTDLATLDALEIDASLSADDMNALLDGLDVCAVLEANQVACTPCPSDGAGDCLTIHFGVAAAPVMADTPVDPLLAPDDPTCI